MNRIQILTGLGASMVAACGGAPPPPAAPAEAPAAASAAPEAAPAAEAPKRVRVESIAIDGGGLAEADVKKALEPVAPEYEKCFASALEAAPDAGGTTLVTLLYVKGKRASVAASYSGPGSDVINKCFTEASDKLSLSPAASVERSVISLKLELTK